VPAPVPRPAAAGIRHGAARRHTATRGAAGQPASRAASAAAADPVRCPLPQRPAVASRPAAAADPRGGHSGPIAAVGSGQGGPAAMRTAGSVPCGFRRRPSRARHARAGFGPAWRSRRSQARRRPVRVTRALSGRFCEPFPLTGPATSSTDPEVRFCGGRSWIRTRVDVRRRFYIPEGAGRGQGVNVPVFWRFRAGFRQAGRRAGVQVETPSVNPFSDEDQSWLSGHHLVGFRRPGRARGCGWRRG
jgi:hypothetical protein